MIDSGKKRMSLIKNLISYLPFSHIVCKPLVKCNEKYMSKSNHTENFGKGRVLVKINEIL